MKWLVAILLFVVKTSFGSHCAGADITYEYLGVHNEYSITLKFYRDCSGIPAPNNPHIDISSASNNFSGYIYGILTDEVEVSKYCTDVVTTCNGGVMTGIQKYTYKANFILPYTASDWVFSFYFCCRNVTITDLSNPSASTFYVYSQLDNSLFDHSSPTFAYDPTPFVCLGYSYCFDNGTDFSGFDSVSYSMIQPKQNSGANVVYVNPFTYLKPITSSPPITFSNGLLCFNPTNQEIDVFAILVSAYKNGVVVSQVERDVQITVTLCPCDPLPVSLNSFVGEPFSDNIRLMWTTDFEVNDFYFDVEKMNKDSSFTIINRVYGKRYSDKQTTYISFDDKPFVGNNIYRLSQTDLDGVKRVLGYNVVYFKHDLNSFLLDYIRGFNLLGQEVR